MSADLGAALTAFGNVVARHDPAIFALHWPTLMTALAARPVERPPQDYSDPNLIALFALQDRLGDIVPELGLASGLKLAVTILRERLAPSSAAPAPGVEALIVAANAAEPRFAGHLTWEQKERVVNAIAAALTGKAGKGPSDPTERGARQP